MYDPRTILLWRPSYAWILFFGDEKLNTTSLRVSARQPRSAMLRVNLVCSSLCTRVSQIFMYIFVQGESEKKMICSDYRMKTTQDVLKMLYNLLAYRILRRILRSQVYLYLIFFVLRTLSRCPRLYDCTKSGTVSIPYVYTSPSQRVTSPNKIGIAFELPEIIFRVM